MARVARRESERLRDLALLMATKASVMPVLAMSNKLPVLPGFAAPSLRLGLKVVAVARPSLRSAPVRHEVSRNVAVPSI
jgi:hypothetical protein